MRSAGTCVRRNWKKLKRLRKGKGQRAEGKGEGKGKREDEERLESRAPRPASPTPAAIEMAAANQAPALRVTKRRCSPAVLSGDGRHAVVFYERTCPGRCGEAEWVWFTRTGADQPWR